MPSAEPNDRPAAALVDLEFPDWSGSRRKLPRVGWEEMHRLSEMLLRNSPYPMRRRPMEKKTRAEFVL